MFFLKRLNPKSITYVRTWHSSGQTGMYYGPQQRTDTSCVDKAHLY